MWQRGGGGQGDSSRLLFMLLMQGKQQRPAWHPHPTPTPPHISAFSWLPLSSLRWVLTALIRWQTGPWAGVFCQVPDFLLFLKTRKNSAWMSSGTYIETYTKMPVVWPWAQEPEAGKEILHEITGGMNGRLGLEWGRHWAIFSDVL